MMLRNFMDGFPPVHPFSMADPAMADPAYESRDVPAAMSNLSRTRLNPAYSALAQATPVKRRHHTSQSFTWGRIAPAF
jgi:hypothetical protein